jgi:hypothetical protein
MKLWPVITGGLIQPKIMPPIAKSVGAKHLGKYFRLLAKILRQMLRPYPPCRRSQNSVSPEFVHSPMVFFLLTMKPPWLH